MRGNACTKKNTNVYIFIPVVDATHSLRKDGLFNKEGVQLQL